MTKQIYGKVLTTALLLGVAATGAHAQLTTTGSYIPTGNDVSGLPVVAATGDTESLAVFQSNILAAYNANTGGDATFDNLNATVGDPAFGNFGNSYSQTPGTPISAKYGTSATNTITFTDGVSLNPNNSGVGVIGAPYSFNNNQAQTQGGGATTSGAVYLGTSGNTSPILFQFSQNLSDFGIIVINRNAATRNVSMTVTLSDGSTVTPVSAVPTSTPTTGPVFFEYAPSAASGLTIASVSLSNPTGFIRMDDLGFVIAQAPVAAPEPSQYAAFAIGILGVGMLALRARKRSVLA